MSSNKRKFEVCLRNLNSKEDGVGAGKAQLIVILKIKS